jgi:hypothetical protein
MAGTRENYRVRPASALADLILAEVSEIDPQRRK